MAAVSGRVTVLTALACTGAALVWLLSADARGESSGQVAEPVAGPTRRFKGNLHAHTLNSDATPRQMKSSAGIASTATTSWC
jgi:hypothetical protein